MRNLLGVVALVLAATVGVCRAEDTAASIPIEDLDKLYAAKDWDRLGQAVAPSPDGGHFIRARNWLLAEAKKGGNFYVAMLLARNDWLIGNARPVAAADVDNIDEDPRISSGMVTLYAFALITIDGTECRDTSASSHRLDQLFQLRAASFRYLASRPEPVRARMIGAAVNFERNTAELRAHHDALLCTGGLESMMAGIRAGRGQEVPTPKGYVGKTIDVSPPPDWRPEFKSPEEYEPAKAKLRAEMRETLQKLLDGIAKASATKP